MDTRGGASTQTRPGKKIVRWSTIERPMDWLMKLCQNCKLVNTGAFDLLENAVFVIPVHGEFVASLSEEPDSDCSACQLFFASRVPVSAFQQQYVSQEVNQYHLRAYSALKMSRDINYASLPSSFRQRDCLFFAVVRDVMFRDGVQEDHVAQVVEDHCWRNGYICKRISRPGGAFFNGRVVQPNLEYSILRHWLDFCCRNHQDCKVRKFQKRDLLSVRVIHCPPASSSLLEAPPLKVVLKPKNCDYVALSYVWGQPTISRPEKTRLIINGMSVPQVVIDAITITQRLGLRYLWVDR
jgi:hypothetical protein